MKVGSKFGGVHFVLKLNYQSSVCKLLCPQQMLRQPFLRQLAIQASMGAF